MVEVYPVGTKVELNLSKHIGYIVEVKICKNHIEYGVSYFDQDYKNVLLQDFEFTVVINTKQGIGFKGD